MIVAIVATRAAAAGAGVVDYGVIGQLAPPIDARSGDEARRAAPRRAYGGFLHLHLHWCEFDFDSIRWARRWGILCVDDVTSFSQ